MGARITLTAARSTTMSRHRAVRNLDLDDELDDGAFEEDEEHPGITPEQQEQMASGLANIQGILGSSSVVTEKEIRDALWYYYFDEEKTVGWLLDQQHKKEAAKAAKEKKKAAAAAATPSTSTSS